MFHEPPTASRINHLLTIDTIALRGSPTVVQVTDANASSSTCACCCATKSSAVISFMTWSILSAWSMSNQRNVPFIDAAVVGAPGVEALMRELHPRRACVAVKVEKCLVDAHSGHRVARGDLPATPPSGLVRLPYLNRIRPAGLGPRDGQHRS